MLFTSRIYANEVKIPWPKEREMAKLKSKLTDNQVTTYKGI